MTQFHLPPAAAGNRHGPGNAAGDRNPPACPQTTLALHRAQQWRGATEILAVWCLGEQSVKKNVGMRKGEIVSYLEKKK
ncbi:hypothetical protein AV530_003882 [Patagioenas fasciata monilis]|uniref:Uncharacterized protein n=1 Tax=Patagioenas fasciata monilis TaxID=372326 RepID=A0A1V4KZ16_PATFA|nr:hypothetical protein AV530_003882 [Patagioenas fasciata monilis]